jgi:YfiH family protein
MTCNPSTPIQTTILMTTTSEADWIRPAWSDAGSVRALITTRAGGCSLGPFAGLNLHPGKDSDLPDERDQPDCVARNRAILESRLPQPPVWLTQVHGTRVLRLTQATLADHTAALADAVFTLDPDLVCAVMVADCLPVLLRSADGRAVGAVHAGWRGLAGGIIQKTVHAMRVATGNDHLPVQAWLGPAIGPAHFEVGAEVLAAMIAGLPQARQAFRPSAPGKWHADLWQLAHQALGQAGVTDVGGGGQCTYANPERFYSFRRDRITGRMAALIWIQSDSIDVPQKK